MDKLPILPEKFPLKELPDTKGQLNALQKLIRRKDVKEIINACDAGREGELIFKYIISYVWNSSVGHKTFKRLWLQSMTSDAIKNGLASLRSGTGDAAPRGYRPLPLRIRLADRHQRHPRPDRLQLQAGRLFPYPLRPGADPDPLAARQTRTGPPEFRARPYSTLLATFTFAAGDLSGQMDRPAILPGRKMTAMNGPTGSGRPDKAEAIIAALHRQAGGGRGNEQENEPALPPALRPDLPAA